MMLEFDVLADFINEIKDEIVMLSENDVYTKNDSGEECAGVLIVLTARISDFIVKYVEPVGTARIKNEKEMDEFMKKRNEKLQSIVKTIQTGGKGILAGTWTP